MIFYITQDKFYSFSKPMQGFYREIIIPEDLDGNRRNKNIIEIILKNLGYRLI